MNLLFMLKCYISYITNIYIFNKYCNFIFGWWFGQRVLSPKDQLNDFKRYILKLKAIAGPSRAKQIISNAVILVSQGNNDIGISFFSTPSALVRGLRSPSRYTTKLAGWNKQFMKVRQKNEILFIKHQYLYHSSTKYLYSLIFFWFMYMYEDFI